MRIATSLLLATIVLKAHEAPAHVTVQIQARPVDLYMKAFVRIPLEAVRDVAFPEIEGGYLDVAKLAPQLSGLAKIWVADALELQENGRRVDLPRVAGTQISIASDKSFATFEQAQERLKQSLPDNSERLFWKQVFFDVALEFPISSANSNFSLRPAFAGLGERVQTVLHYRDKTLLLSGDQELFPLEPSWIEAVGRFARMGFLHILSGADHLLFVLCLVISSTRFRTLAGVVTAFTLAHSLTLAASAVNMVPDALWFPPLVELAIALSIVAMALANILGWNKHSWQLGFGFGLIHGFGFSFALRESMQFAGSHLVTALFSFNLGVELGQLAALLVLVPAIRRLPSDSGIPQIVLSSLVAHTAWHWMLDRWEILARYSFSSLVVWNPAVALRWVLFALSLFAAWWLVRRWIAGKSDE